MYENHFTRPRVTARKVLRSEGDVWRYSLAGIHHGWSDVAACEHLRSLGCGPSEALGILDDARVAASRETVFPL